MVGHQAIGEEAHRGSFPSLAEQLEKGIEVPLLAEDGAATVASVEDMVTVATLRSTSSTRHALDYGQGTGKSNRKVQCPLLFFAQVAVALRGLPQKPQP